MIVVVGDYGLLLPVAGCRFFFGTCCCLLLFVPIWLLFLLSVSCCLLLVPNCYLLSGLIVIKNWL